MSRSRYRHSPRRTREAGPIADPQPRRPKHRPRLNDPNSGCGKTTYPTQGAADAVVLASSVVVRSYHCPGCGLWHTTSQPNRSQEAA